MSNSNQRPNFNESIRPNTNGTISGLGTTKVTRGLFNENDRSVKKEENSNKRNINK
ncbi:hypothetical protein [Priestia megaterium]|uniref:hypothetical protein n=1 Tax=Priestia megaterium TaxID=1404 RepID=UPI002E1A2A3F|nr:hypothetical protein [Priestia megaterium]